MINPQSAQDNCKTCQWFTFLSYLLITLLISSFVVVEYCMSKGLLSRDGYGYWLYTQEALTAGWQAAAVRFPDMPDYPPLLMMLMYAAGRLGINIELFGRILNIAGILLTGWGILYCARKLYSNKITALAAALAVMSIPKIYLEGCDILRDPLYWSCIIWAMAMLLRLSNDEKNPLPAGQFYLRSLILAVCCALGCISRKEGLFFSGIIGLWIIFYAPVKLTRKSVMFIIFASVTFLGIMLPYLCGVPWNIFSFTSIIGMGK